MELHISRDSYLPSHIIGILYLDYKVISHTHVMLTIPEHIPSLYLMYAYLVIYAQLYHGPTHLSHTIIDIPS